MKLAELIQALSDQRIPLKTEPHVWSPLWRILTVRIVNSKPVITNRPY